MARATSVYAVFNGNKPVRGFTVKHELQTWLRGHLPEYLDLMHVYKLPDNNNSFESFEVDIVELLR